MSDDVETPVEADNAQAPAETDNVETPASEPVTETNWRDALPEDIRDDTSLAKFTDLGAFAKSYKSLEGMLGGDKVPVPKDDEGWDRWFKAAGRPDEAGGYEFEKPESVPDGMQYSEEMDNRFREIAHKHGLSQTQAQAVRGDFLEVLAEGYTEQTQGIDAITAQAIAQAEAELKREWGHAYDRKLGDAKKAVERFAGEEFKAYLDETGLGNDHRLIRAFADIAAKTMGESELTGDGKSAAQTPADLDRAIADHRTKHAAALHDKRHPDHIARTKEMTELFALRYPEQVA